MIAVDTETYLIRPGLLVPRLVCMTVAWGEGPTPAWVPSGAVVDGGAALLTAEDAVGVLPVVLGGPTTWANAPYDLAVLSRAAGSPSAAFDAVRAGRVHDVQIRERLLLLARGVPRGRVSLADLVRWYLGEERGDALLALKGPDAWRMRYAELDGVPLEYWPDAATAYALDDARLTLAVHDAQGALGRTPGGTVGGYPVVLPDGTYVSEDREVRAAWALHLAAAYGLRTDPVAVDALIRTLEIEAAAGRVAGEAGGWIRSVGKKAGTLDKKALQAVVSAAYRGNPPTTAPTKTYPLGQVSIATDTLLAAADLPGAPETLRASAGSLRAGKILSVWAEPLRHATTAPSTYRVTSLLETGRVSVADPPWQQPPRTGGVRECVVPRPGYLLCSVDYETAELVALAQVLVWGGMGSTMADAINAGQDLHIRTAAAIRTAEDHATSYEEMLALYRAGDPEAKHLRQLAKVANFGFPGGLGAARFVDYAASQGVTISLPAAKILREAWLATWPEMRAYFDHFARALSHASSITVQHPVSGRVRGGVGYTDGCNGLFQGLVADIAKDALWRLAAAAYDTPTSAFYGSRPVLLLHDEVIAEVPTDRAHEAAEEMAAIMLAAARDHIPNVTMRAEPALMARWFKGAKTIRDNNGLLLPWAPPETT